MSLSYTTGNPNNLTGGSGASMTDIQGPFTDIKTFLTDGSGTVGDTILASPTNAIWRTVMTSGGPIVSLGTTPQYFSTNGFGGSSLTAQGMWVPPAAGDVAVTGKTARLRVRVAWVVNTIAPAISLTWGLYPVTSGGGAGGLITLSLGTVVAGSTATATTPSATSFGAATGSSFDMSAVTAGNLYVLGVVGSGNSQTANSNVACQMNLEMRHT